MKLSKTFNAESAVRDLGDAIERQIDALRATDKGFVSTLTSLAKDRFKIMKATKQLSEAFHIPSREKTPFELINQIADKAAEQKIPGGERLQQLQGWSKTFWLKDDVKKANAIANPFKNLRSIKALAQQQPKP